MNKKIMKTFIFSRHTLRRPLFQYMSFVEKLNRQNFRDWSNESLEITKKGIEVEKILDEKLKEYIPLKSNNQFKLYITNTDRTQETAKILIKNVFDKDINPKFYVNMSKFYTIFPKDDIEFKQKLISVLNDKLNTFDLEKLRKANEFLDKYIEQERKSIFNFKDYNLGFDFEDTFLPKFLNNQYILFQLTDILYSEFYDGYLKDLDLINTVRYIKEVDLELISKTEGVCEYLAYPVLKNLYNYLNSNSNKTQVYLGHDVNILAILKSLNITTNHLDKIIEAAPIGSKIIFYETDDNLINIDFIYLDNIKFEDIIVNNLYSSEKSVFLDQLKSLIDKFKI